MASSSERAASQASNNTQNSDSDMDMDRLPGNWKYSLIVNEKINEKISVGHCVISLTHFYQHTKILR